MYKCVKMRYNVINETENDVFREKDFYNKFISGILFFKTFMRT